MKLHQPSTLTLADAARLDAIAADVHDSIFNLLDCEFSFGTAEAGIVATAVEKAFRATIAYLDSDAYDPRSHTPDGTLAEGVEDRCDSNAEPPALPWQYRPDPPEFPDAEQDARTAVVLLAQHEAAVARRIADEDEATFGVH